MNEEGAPRRRCDVPAIAEPDVGSCAYRISELDTRRKSAFDASPSKDASDRIRVGGIVRRRIRIPQCRATGPNEGRGDGQVATGVGPIVVDANVECRVPRNKA